MRCFNASLTTPDASSLSSRRRHHERSRVSVVTRVAQDRSDAAAPTVPSSSDRTAAGFIAIETSSSHVVAGTTTAVAGSVVSGRSDVQQHNGHPLQGGPQGPPVSGHDVSSTAQQLPSASSSSHSSSSSSSSRPGDVGPSSRSSNGMPSRQVLGDFSSISSSSGGGGGPASTAVAWQPPSYRRAGLRLRSKRALQAAEKMQQAGKSLIAEELQKMVTSTSSSSDAADEEDRDQHLEAFIEQMLCPKTSSWKRADAAPGAAVDGRKAIDPDVLANIHTLPVAQITQQQTLLARRGQLLAALLLLEEAAAAGRRDVMLNTEQKAFLRAAGKQGNTNAVLRFLQLLPAEMAHAHTYNLALKACADARDLRAALRVVDIMGIRQVPTDFKHFTTLIAVCASTGDANQAFAVFQKAKAAEQQVAAAAAAAAAAAGADKQQQKAAGKVAPRMDGQVYGALIAACAQAIRVRSSDLREQLVILERAFQVLQEGVDAGVYLDTPVWNALLMCAGRCRQLQRCFEVLDRMTAAGVPSNSITYTCLIEAAVLSGDVDMAQRVFARAMATGVTNSVQLYTAAINACMTDDHTNFDAAFEIYTTMQRHGVEPDDLLYGHLIAIAGRCRKLEVAFDLLEDMRASGLTPSTPTCSALIYACLQNNNFAAARKVYDTLIARGVSPHISQFNSLMEQYALRFQLGNVVSVLTSMVGGGVQPNANTFRILLLACQRTDQAELAFELYQVMKARGLQPRLNNAHSICYTLLTACFSRIRKSWWPGGYPPKPTSSMGPYSNLPGLRPAEARQLLQVLQPGAFQAGKGGSSAAAAAGSSARQAQQQARRYNFLDNAENINWPLLALSTYRDFISWGYKPHLEVLDKLLACLRLQLPKSPQRPAAELQQRAVQLQAQLQPLQHPDAPGALSQQHTSSSGAEEQADLASSMQQQGQGQGQGPRQWLQTAGLLRDLARERRMQESEDRPYEVPFDKRAIDAVVDAIGMGLLPALKLDAPLVVDMRSFPPSVAEAYVHMLMSTLDSRAASAAAEGKRQPVAQRVRLIVPPFDHNYVMWPSYVEKLHVHYSEQLLARQAQLRYEAMAARARAAALAAQNLDGDEDEDIADDQLLLTFGSTAAAAAGAAAGSGSSPAAAALRAAMLAQGGQSAAIAMAAAAAGRGRRTAASMMRSWDVSEFGDDLLGADMTGYSAALASSQPGVATAAQGRYIAGAVTGLAAAATFRRLKAYARMDSAAGAIKLESQELNRWMMAKVRYEDERRRIAREAEIAAAGYSNNLQYYHQQQQQQQQQAQQPGQQWAPNTNSWQQQQPAQTQPPQQQQQQLPQVQQEQQRPEAVDQGGAANGSSKQGGPAAAGAAAGRTQGSSGQGPGSSQRPVRGYSSSWEQPQQQQQQQQKFMPGFGPRAGTAGVSGLQQQARDIRLGIGPAAAAGLNRPNRGSAAAPQQQPALTHVQPTGPHQQVQQSAAQEGSPDSSSSSSKSSSSRSRRAHRQAAAAAAGSGAESAAQQSRSASSSVDQQ